MAFPGDQPTNQLTTERTRGQRRAALTAVALIAVVVGALIWKPWDSPSGAPHSTAVAVVATATPTNSPAETHINGVIVPPPELLPIVPGPVTNIDSGPQVIAAPDGLGSVAFYPNEGPGVWCIYKAATTDQGYSLTVMVVEPPIVIVNHGASPQLRSVRWHIELETNTQDKLFESEWIPVARSKASAIDVTRGQFGFRKPISLDVPSADSITVFRAPIVIEWLGAKQAVLATQRIVPTTYGVLGTATSAAQPAGCPTTV